MNSAHNLGRRRSPPCHCDVHRAGMEITRLAPFQDARDRMPGTSVLDGCVYPESVRFREFSNT